MTVKRDERETIIKQKLNENTQSKSRNINEIRGVQAFNETMKQK